MLDLSAVSIVSQDAEVTSEQLQALQAQLIDLSAANHLSAVFKALGDPTRLRIVSLLLDNEVCVHTLETLMGMSQSAISHQLRVLRHLDLVRFRKEGRHVYYSIADADVRELIKQGLVHIQHL